MEENKKAKRIKCHPDLIEILERLREKLGALTYDVISDKATYYDLTGILAKKIGNKV